MVDVEKIEPTYEEFDNMLDEAHEPCVVGMFVFDPSRVLAELDPIAYRTGYNEYANDATKYMCGKCGLNHEDEDIAELCCAEEEENGRT